MSGWLGNHVITQIGILVNDIEKVSRAYADFFGLEKPDIVVTDTADIAQTRYNGGKTEARAKLAFFDMGSLQLELIEPDHQPSTWRDYLNEHGEGPHHIAFAVEGMKEKIMLLEGKGFPLQQKGEYTGGRYAYMDTFKELKVLVELLENDNN
ncbi:VOC family protein [Paenibacillus jilunlii]|uniref:Glyoxalase/Bleomycin resistance protein/Dioxygenase superfamily protein n=1 Tax=Paenibacillus jilunlii TaxID=682956 RepID=A0A1G9UTQ3_9BACL|nr:VOC family protein [Paenibacillus jilunlii]KWX78235.1 lactoylglutathione lyase [Paenibacillus jilunlii]SDM63312.1 Glyoxalase/Bleomycin resistance protein/Dioxygenase superfamily protein [Paenibacillus jilunlii]